MRTAASFGFFDLGLLLKASACLSSDPLWFLGSPHRLMNLLSLIPIEEIEQFLILVLLGNKTFFAVCFSSLSCVFYFFAFPTRLLLRRCVWMIKLHRMALLLLVGCPV